MGSIANFYHSPEFKRAFGAGPADGPSIYPGGGSPLPPPPPPVLAPAGTAPAVEAGGPPATPLAPDVPDAAKKSLLGS